MTLFFLLLALIIAPAWSHAATKIAIHVTAEELAIWQTRWNDSAYASIKNDILNKANAATESRWLGRQTNSCFQDGNVTYPGRRKDEGLLDAGFVYLITGTTSYRTKVRDALIAQAAVAGTDFSNTARWCPTNAFQNGYGEDIAPWLIKLIYAYSYIRADISAGDRTTLDTWFTNAALHFKQVEDNLTLNANPLRYQEQYPTCASGSCPGSALGDLYNGGPTTYAHSRKWNNIQSTMVNFSTAVGVVTNNATLKNHGKIYFKEFLRFSVYSGASNGLYVHDQHRWDASTSTDAGAPNAYAYPLISIGNLIAIADHLARDGDTSLYTYVAANPTGRYGSEGSNKTLLRVLQTYARMTLGDIVVNATPGNGCGTEPIDSTGKQGATCSTVSRIEYINLAPANMFYNDSEVRNAYLKPFGSNIATSGCDPDRGGAWCTYPSVRLMWFNMETAIPGGVFGTVPGLPEGTEIVGKYSWDNAATDASVAANDATATSITYGTSGVIENTHYAILNAATDVLSVPTVGHTASQGTLYTLAYADDCTGATNSVPQYIYGHTSSASAYVNRMQWYLTDNSGCKLNLGWGGTHNTLNEFFSMTAATWYGLALTWENGTINAYAIEKGQGAIAAVGSASYTSLSEIGSAAAWGNNGRTNDQALIGRLDASQQWNRVLTLAELVAHHNTVASETEDPPEEPTFDALALGTCEIGTVASNQLRCTYTGTPDPAECNVLANFSLNDGAFDVTGCALSEVLALTIFPTPDDDDTLTLDYLGTPNQEESVTNNIVVTTPVPDTEMTDYRFACVNSAEGACWRTRENQPLRIASGFPFWVRYGIGNTGAATAPESFNLWCGTGGTANTRVTSDCETLGICYDLSPDISRNGATIVNDGTVLTEKLTTPGGSTFVSGGRAKTQSAEPTTVVIGTNQVIEVADKLRTKAGLALDTTFDCAPRTLAGAELDDSGATFEVVITSSTNIQ